MLSCRFLLLVNAPLLCWTCIWVLHPIHMAYAVQASVCSNVNTNTRIYSRKDLAWFIIFIRVIYDFRDHSGNDRKPGSLQFQCQFELSVIWGLLSVLLPFLKCIFYYLLYPVALKAFSWDFTLKGLYFEKIWAPIQMKPFPQYSPLLRHQSGLSNEYSKLCEGFTKHFNPGQCWSHGGVFC